MLKLLVTSTVKTRELWIPRLRLSKMACELCGLMAHAATWTVAGDGDSRYAWLHILCEYCHGNMDREFAHALKIEAYEQRRGAAKIVNRPRLAKVAGL